MEFKTMQRLFPRSFKALPDIFSYLNDFFVANEINELHRFSVEFATEEIFTNFVKYHPDGEQKILIELAGQTTEMQVLLIDRNVEPFDFEGLPPVDTTAALKDRSPGGLGLHITRKLVDSVDYEYAAKAARVTLIKHLADADTEGASPASGDDGTDAKD